MTETEFSHIVLDFLQSKLSQSGFDDIFIVEGTNNKVLHNYVIRHFAFGKEKNGKWTIFGGCDDLDIILFKETVPRKFFPKELFQFTGTGIRGNNLIIPLVTIELKEKFPGTHDLMASSKIATDIKTLFPHCACYFLSHQHGSNSYLSLIRLAQGFDGAFADWEKVKENIWQKIRQHLDYLKTIKII